MSSSTKAWGGAAMTATAVLVAAIIAAGGGGTQADSVTVGAITFTFSEEKRVGQYVNGDWWVLGPVTITAMTPAYSAGAGGDEDNKNGWQVNPVLLGNRLLGDGACIGGDCGTQSLDGDAAYYDEGEMPALPYDAEGGESIVKGKSLTPGEDVCGFNTCLEEAAVLTVVSTPPPNNGATVFRPPYMGTDKPQYTTSNLDAQMATLPDLASSPAIDDDLPTQDYAIERIEKPNVSSHVEELSIFQATVNVGLAGIDDTPYGPQIGNVYVESVLRALIVKPGDDEDKRRQIMVSAIQRGIDVIGAREMGMNWYAAGAVNHGYMLPAVVAAYMLDNQRMKNVIEETPHNAFQETGDVQDAQNAGTPLWGQARGDETGYWNDIDNPGSNGTMYDPYGYIDGGRGGQTYQWCCTTAHLKGNVLVVRLMGMEDVWDDQNTLDYIERWVTAGKHTQPDPCEPRATGGGPDPSGPNCILDDDLTPGSTFTDFSCQEGEECGRFPDEHGDDVDDAATASPLVNDVYAVHRGEW